jgi:hypothetical protein
MSQHDFDLASGQSGSNLRTDVQNALRALASMSSGASEPATMYAYQLWLDTTNGLIKQRNGANTGWIIRSTAAETRVVAKSSAYTVVDDDFGKTFKASGTWSLALTAAATLADGFWFEVRNTGSGTITIDPDGSEQVDGATTVALAAGESCTVVCDGAGFFTIGRPTTSATTVAVPVRQTVLSGPVDSNGLAAFGGSTGGTTVTMTGTLIATAANGFGSSGAVDVVGSGTNLAWSGLSTNGTMYLYVDIAAGVLTSGSGTLAPVYQHGGTYSTTSGQFTFNRQEMVGKVGNGSSAVQTNRVYVGEVTVAGSVVTAIKWYQLMGRYTGAWTATLPGANTTTAASHLLGCADVETDFEIECTTTDGGWAVGDRLRHNSLYANDASARAILPLYADSLTASLIVNNSTAITASRKDTRTAFITTAASWKYRFHAQRSW